MMADEHQNQADDPFPSAPPAAAPPQTSEAVLTLQAMFPDMEEAVLEAVLVSCRNDVEAAIEALLAMSDPSAAAANVAVSTADEERGAKLADDVKSAFARGQQRMASQRSGMGLMGKAMACVPCS